LTYFKVWGYNYESDERWEMVSEVLPCFYLPPIHQKTWKTRARPACGTWKLSSSLRKIINKHYFAWHCSKANATISYLFVWCFCHFCRHSTFFEQFWIKSYQKGRLRKKELWSLFYLFGKEGSIVDQIISFLVGSISSTSLA
jgi:hypothetical protein